MGLSPNHVRCKGWRERVIKSGEIKFKIMCIKGEQGGIIDRFLLRCLCCFFISFYIVYRLQYVCLSSGLWNNYGQIIMKLGGRLGWAKREPHYGADLNHGADIQTMF